MILAAARMETRVMMVLYICLRVARNTCPMTRPPAFCRQPPMMAAIKISTPGVLIQEILYGLAPSPE